jgi:hypothetical protein
MAVQRLRDDICKCVAMALHNSSGIFSPFLFATTERLGLVVNTPALYSGEVPDSNFGPEVEDGGTVSFRNFGVCLYVYTSLQPRRSTWIKFLLVVHVCVTQFILLMSGS